MDNHSAVGIHPTVECCIWVVCCCDRTTLDLPHKIRCSRAEVIRLSAHGRDVEKIAAYFNWTPDRLRRILKQRG